VDGDVARLATRGGAQQGVIGRDEADLDREAHGEATLADRRAHRAHRGGCVCTRHGVLHLGEPHAPGAGEDRVRPIDAAARADRVRDGAVDRGDRTRCDTTGGAGKAEEVVAEQNVVDPGARRGRRRGRRIGAVVRARQREVRVREREQLEVVV